MEEEITFLAVKLAVRRDDLFAAASDQQHSLKIHRQSFDEHHIRSFPEKRLKQSAFKKKDANLSKLLLGGAGKLIMTSEALSESSRMTLLSARALCIFAYVLA